MSPAVLLMFAPLGLAPADFELASLATLAPSLHSLVQRALAEPTTLANELRESPLAAIAPMMSSGKGLANSSLPVVVTHGMGDSCFNPGMSSVTKFAATTLNTYSLCIPTADSQIMDTIDGFLKNMDASVDEFAKRVRNDPKLAGGFNAFGLSQGNNLIRGYISKYNDPPVNSFISICGVNAGVAAFPHCSPKTPLLGGICEVVTEVLGALAYNPIVQGILFQANYFRDPTKVNSTAYKSNSQLAKWNGESGDDMTKFKANWAKTKSFTWIEGTLDTTVWPRQGEQWGVASDNYPKDLSVLDMKRARWYTQDSFGLRTADETGKNHFESFAGEHIRFTEKELEAWLLKYFA